MERKIIQRTVRALKRFDRAYVITGKQLYESMKHMRRFVLLADCLIWVGDLRELARLYWRDSLLVRLPDLDSERPTLHIETVDGANKSRFFDRRTVPHTPSNPTSLERCSWDLYKCLETPRRSPEPPTGTVTFYADVPNRDYPKQTKLF